MRLLCDCYVSVHRTVSTVVTTLVTTLLDWSHGEARHQPGSTATALNRGSQSAPSQSSRHEGRNDGRNPPRWCGRRAQRCAGAPGRLHERRQDRCGGKHLACGVTRGKPTPKALRTSCQMSSLRLFATPRNASVASTAIGSRWDRSSPHRTTHCLI